MADVFISYKKEDATFAARVADALREAEFSCWWDDSLTPKTAWDAVIEREIAAAAAVLVLWTPRSISSEWVRTEAHYALDRGKLVPAIIEDCAIPIAFMLRQTVRLTTWSGEPDHRDWRKLLTWIADLVATKPGNANLPQPLKAAQPNRFRKAIGSLHSGEPVVDGMLVNAATPPATVFRDQPDSPALRILPAGSFIIGSPASDQDRSATEGPQRRIEFHTPFAIGVFPVLVAEYTAIMDTPSRIGSAPDANPLLPVVEVSHEDALQYLSKLSGLTRETYRLPSEAEWEYACRAGSRSRFGFGDNITSTDAVFAATGPAPPGQFRPNDFGLWDMHGNVREWTADLWHESYDALPVDGSPMLDGQGSMRVVRGGGWGDPVVMLRSAARMRATVTTRSPSIGFRAVRELI